MRERRRAEKPAIAPKPSRGGGTGSMGQLWMKLDELKRENEELRRQGIKTQEEKRSTERSTGPGDVIIADLHKTRLENETLELKLQKAENTIKVTSQKYISFASRRNLQRGMTYIYDI